MKHRRILLFSLAALTGGSLQVTQAQAAIFEQSEVINASNNCLVKAHEKGDFFSQRLRARAKLNDLTPLETSLHQSVLLREPALVESLLALTRHKDKQIRVYTARYLGIQGDIEREKVIPGLLQLMQDKDPHVRAEALKQIQKLRIQEAAGNLLKSSEETFAYALKNQNSDRLEVLMNTMGELKNPEFAPFLWQVLKHSDWERGFQYGSAALALAQLRSPGIAEHIPGLFQAQPMHYYVMAMRQLKDHRLNADVLQQFERMEQEGGFFPEACLLLGATGATESIPYLRQRLQQLKTRELKRMPDGTLYYNQGRLPLIWKWPYLALALHQLGDASGTAALKQGMALLPSTGASPEQIFLHHLCGLFLAENGHPEVLPELVQTSVKLHRQKQESRGHAHDLSVDLRAEMFKHLKTLPIQQGVPLLTLMAFDYHPELQTPFQRALLTLPDSHWQQSALPVLLKLLAENPDDQKWVSLIMHFFMERNEQDVLLELAQSPHFLPRMGAITALIQLGHPQSEPLLKRVTQDFSSAFLQSAPWQYRSIHEFAGKLHQISNRPCDPASDLISPY